MQQSCRQHCPLDLMDTLFPPNHRDVLHIHDVTLIYTRARVCTQPLGDLWQPTFPTRALSLEPCHTLLGRPDTVCPGGRRAGPATHLPRSHHFPFPLSGAAVQSAGLTGAGRPSGGSVHTGFPGWRERCQVGGLQRAPHERGISKSS